MALTKAQLVRRGNDNKLIFLNFLNRVPKPQIAVDFKRSPEDVTRTIAHVAKQICAFRHMHCMKPTRELGMLPPIPCATEDEMLTPPTVDVLRRMLDHLGPETLASEFLLLPALTAHTLDANASAADVQEAAHAVRARTLPFQASA